MQQPSRRRWRRAIAAPLFLLLGLACTPRPQYPECRNDASCAAQGQVCVSGFCRDCRDDSQCKPNEQCVADGCVRKPECSAAALCAEGFVCRAGVCAPECGQDVECGEGRRCAAGRCISTAECSGDGECGLGKACVEGKCLAQTGIDHIYSGAALSCVAGPIYFDFGDDSLDARARASIAAAWACVQGEGFRRIRLLGNTDERGTTEYNLALGSKRAEAVRRYLIGLGADGQRLRAISFGKERPAEDGHDEAAWAKNRRVELDVEK